MRVLLPVGRPVDRVAGAGVLVGLRHRLAGDTVLVGVGDDRLRTRLGDDLLQARLVQRQDVVAAAVDPVGTHLVIEANRRQGQVRTAFAGVPDLVQPQRLVGGVPGVPRIQVLLLQRERVHRREPGRGGGRVPGVRRDGGHALAGEEGGADVPGALVVGLADCVEGDVGPVVTGVFGQFVAAGATGGAALAVVEGDLVRGGRAAAEQSPGALAVSDFLQVAATGVGGAGAVVAEGVVVVGLGGVPVGHGVLVEVFDVVEVPPPCLLLVPAGQAGAVRVAGLTGVVTEDRDRPHRLGAFVGGRTVELVQSEDVLGALTRDDCPVLTVVVTVLGAGGVRDRRSVVILQPPDTCGVVLDQFTRLAVEDEGGIVVLPAEVELIRLAVVITGAVLALDIGRSEVEAFTNRRALVVRRGRPPVHTARVIGDRQIGRRPAAAGGVRNG